MSSGSFLNHSGRIDNSFSAFHYFCIFQLISATVFSASFCSLPASVPQSFFFSILHLLLVFSLFSIFLLKPLSLKASVFLCLALSSHVWLCLSMSGYVFLMSGSVFLCLALSSYVWLCLPLTLFLCVEFRLSEMNPALCRALCHESISFVVWLTSG